MTGSFSSESSNSDLLFYYYLNNYNCYAIVDGLFVVVWADLTAMTFFTVFNRSSHYRSNRYSSDKVIHNTFSSIKIKHANWISAYWLINFIST